MTMEVEARNLDKKVCVEGDPGVSRMKGTRMVCWGSGQAGYRGLAQWLFLPSLITGLCGIDRTSWGNRIHSWSSSARVMGNGTWHTDLRCEPLELGVGG